MECYKIATILLIILPGIVFAFMFGSLCVLTILKKDTFHPFFNVLLSVFLCNYALGELITVVSRALWLLYSQCILLSILTAIFGLPFTFDLMKYSKASKNSAEICYSHASTCAILLLFERTLATWKPAFYEKFRPWCLFWFCQFISFSVGSVMVILIYMPTTDYDNRYRDCILLFFMFIIVILLALLLSCNKVMTKNSTGRGVDLNARYQLIENIRTLKIIIPAIVLDLMLTAVDLASEYIFSVPYFVENNRCRDNTYMLKFIVIKTVHNAIEVAIPSWIFYSHPHLKRTITSSETVFVGRSGPVITNVFGQNVGDAKQEETYETVLNRMWIHTK